MRRDRGAAAVWMLACGALVMAVAAAVLVRSLAVLARHRAEAAADLAALAGAGRIGTGGDPCVAAREIAAGNGAAVRSCVVNLDAAARTGTVRVVVVTSARLPVVGVRSVTARARAGRLPGPLAARVGCPGARSRRAHPLAATCRSAPNTLWHADAGRNRSSIGCRSGAGTPNRCE